MDNPSLKGSEVKAFPRFVINLAKKAALAPLFASLITVWQLSLRNWQNK